MQAGFEHCIEVLPTMANGRLMVGESISYTERNKKKKSCVKLELISTHTSKAALISARIRGRVSKGVVFPFVLILILRIPLKTLSIGVAEFQGLFASSCS